MWGPVTRDAGQKPGNFPEFYCRMRPNRPEILGISVFYPGIFPASRTGDCLRRFREIFVGYREIKTRFRLEAAAHTSYPSSMELSPYTPATLAMKGHVF